MPSTAKIIDSNGLPGRLKLRRIREHHAAGAGQWIDGVFVFSRRAASTPSSNVRHSPTIGRITSRRVDSFSGSDSGYNLLPYPIPYGVTSAPRFPALARQGAGL